MHLVKYNEIAQRNASTEITNNLGPGSRIEVAQARGFVDLPLDVDDGSIAFEARQHFNP